MGKPVSKKKLCNVSRTDIAEEYGEYVRLTNDPEYVCKKCNRTSRIDKNLCKPKKIKGKGRDDE